MLVTKKHTRLKAFTITELVIGMAISSLIITITYLIYTNISKQLVEYQLHQNELMEYNQFQSVLAKDVMLCTRLQIVNAQHIELVIAGDQIEYFFEEDQIIRKTNTTQTFDIKIQEVLLNNSERIDEEYKTIQLKLNLLGQQIIVFEEKKISNADHINHYFLDEY